MGAYLKLLPLLRGDRRKERKGGIEGLKEGF
jgi:hypothetical protein